MYTQDELLALLDGNAKLSCSELADQLREQSNRWLKQSQEVDKLRNEWYQNQKGKSFVVNEGIFHIVFHIENSLPEYLKNVESFDGHVTTYKIGRHSILRNSLEFELSWLNNPYEKGLKVHDSKEIPDELYQDVVKLYTELTTESDKLIAKLHE